MSINHLYDTWFQHIRQLWPDQRLPLYRNLAWFLTGLYLSRSVQLHRVAEKIPSAAKLPSVTRRLSRWLAQPRLRVRPWYEPLARSLLQAMAASVGEIRLIVDGTAIGSHHQLLMISLAFRRRAL